MCLSFCAISGALLDVCVSLAVFNNVLSFSIVVLYILLYHVVFMMFMLSYWVTIRTKPAEPSEKV